MKNQFTHSNVEEGLHKKSWQFDLELFITGFKRPFGY